jgi:DNA-binding response OmpR family regulator
MQRVFIVDDSADIRELFGVLADLHGFILHTAKDGEEALEKLKGLKDEPSIVFVDFNMPLMNGNELVRKIREGGLASKSRIVFFSARERDTVLNLYPSLMWLAKPFNLSEVLKVINLSRLH